MGGLMGSVLPAAAYGIIRAPAVNMTAMVPRFAGNYTDEVILGVAGYLLAKRGKGFIRNLGMSALIVESAALGSQVSGGFTGMSSTTISEKGWN